MGIIVAILAIAVVLLIKSSSDKKHTEKGILIRDIYAKYLGGHPHLEGGKDFHLNVYKDKIEFEFLNNDSKTFYFNKINNIKIMSETTISNEISLGKLLVFGVISFALKDNKTNVQNYLVVNYNDEKINENIDLVISCKDKENIIKIYNEFKVSK